MYDLGIIGGMGPLASAEIYRRIIETTKANKDQAHLSIVILNKPNIPDRSLAILESGESPVAILNEALCELEKLNVKNYIIACNTAHYFINDLKKTKINFISLIDEALISLNNIKDPVIILSTKGTIEANIYKTSKYSKKLNIIYPEVNSQKIIMEYIYQVKSGLDKISIMGNLLSVLDEYKNKYPNCVFVLACTELSLVFDYLSKKYKVIDAADCLVKAVILKCGYEIKD